MRPSSLLRLGAALSFAALAAAVVRLAWLGDDACITLRAVEHWMLGFGPNWNAAERAQAFTHPLWMLVLAAGRVATGESFFTTIALSAAISLAAAALLLRAAKTARAAIAIGCLLLFSRGFTEYATSGLENPLAFLLLAAFAAVVGSEREPTQRYALAALLTGLSATTRMDLGLLCAPAALAAARGVPAAAVVWRGAAGLSPFLLWAAFATVYYGSPFPVTAYAKAIAVGLPAGEVAQQGLHYLWYVATRDPVTMATVVAGAAVGFAVPRLRCRALAAGVVLYCVYVVKVGGDFMGARFFTPQFVVAAAILARWLATVDTPWLWAHATLAPALHLLAGVPPWLQPPSNDQPPNEGYHGILDERLFYYWQQGLFGSDRSPPKTGAFSAAARLQNRTRPMVATWGMVGRYGLEAGDLLHIVDPWLLDPLLMRLPIHEPEGWRIGHFVRRVPEGYLETIATGENRIHHPGLRRYYDVLRTVIRAPVFDGARLHATFDLLRGAHDADLRSFVAEEYRTPPRLRVPAADLAAPVAVGTQWFDEPRVRIVYLGGLRVEFAAPASGSALRLSVLGERDYDLRLLRGGQELGRVVARAQALSRFAGVHELTVALPPGTGAFDAIDIDSAMTVEFTPGIGGLVVVP